MTHEQFADAIAHSLEARQRMLRLSTADFHEREAHCRRELVFNHKQAFALSHLPYLLLTASPD